MSHQAVALILGWVPEDTFSRLRQEFPTLEFLDGREASGLDAELSRANIAYGLPPTARLGEASALRWVQLASAGVPRDFSKAAHSRGLTVTNLAGLYGSTIAEHALTLTTILARNLHVVFRQQAARTWDRDVMKTMWDLQGKTMAIVGLGNIGRGIARLGRAYGMRVVGCRRGEGVVPEADLVYPRHDLRAMLAEADVVAVAAPLTDETEGMLGPQEFAAMKRGALYINVSRGAVALESALLDALKSGHLSGAGLDVFAVEPLPNTHPLWTMPNVVISPHYSGETVNNSGRPIERFRRNLHQWLTGGKLEGVVRTELAY